MKNITVNIVVEFWQSSSHVAKCCWQSSWLLRVNLQTAIQETPPNCVSDFTFFPRIYSVLVPVVLWAATPLDFITSCLRSRQFPHGHSLLPDFRFFIDRVPLAFQLDSILTPAACFPAVTVLLINMHIFLMDHETLIDAANSIKQHIDLATSINTQKLQTSVLLLLLILYAVHPLDKLPRFLANILVLNWCISNSAKWLTYMNQLHRHQ